jgi:hypothetical protein
MVVASSSVVVDDMTKHEHAAGQKLRMRFSEEASGIERDLF